MRKLSALVVVLFVGCALREGDACSTGEACDEDGVHALICESGTVKRVACPGGCSMAGEQASCNPHGVSINDACAASMDGWTTCGGVAVLQCSAGVWSKQRDCPEPTDASLAAACAVSSSSGVDARCQFCNASLECTDAP